MMSTMDTDFWSFEFWVDSKASLEEIRDLVKRFAEKLNADPAEVCVYQKDSRTWFNPFGWQRRKCFVILSPASCKEGYPKLADLMPVDDFDPGRCDRR